jgi:DNA-directed RNA polymerase specialized sigma24 family protein
MEREIERLNALEKKLLAMNVLEEYTIPEVARLLGCTQRTVERFLQDAPDQLSPDPACRWFDGTMTLSYGRIKNLSRG